MILLGSISPQNFVRDRSSFKKVTVQFHNTKSLCQQKSSRSGKGITKIWTMIEHLFFCNNKISNFCTKLTFSYRFVIFEHIGRRVSTTFIYLAETITMKWHSQYVTTSLVLIITNVCLEIFSSSLIAQSFHHLSLDKVKKK